MATDGTTSALMVFDSATQLPIEIPLKIQEKILEPMVKFRTWIFKHIRTGGTGKMQPGGKIWYAAYPKQQKARKLELEYGDGDDKTKLIGGIYGPATDADGGNSNKNFIGGVKSTYGTEIVEDYITLKGATFLKEAFTIHDIEREGLANLIVIKLRDFIAESTELVLVYLKKEFVKSIGLIGKWATDRNWKEASMPAAGPGKRLQAKTYPATAAGGKSAIKDIRAALRYRDKIGLKDGVESEYPLSRGLDSSKSCLIEISSDINESMATAIQESGNGFLVGLGYSKEDALIKSISYDNRKVPISVVTDMPNKDDKAFNWLITEIGKYGAIGYPNLFSKGSLVRPHYEGLTLYGKVLESISLEQGLKFFQPELMFASFKA